jgi:hypothetical protein
VRKCSETAASFLKHLPCLHTKTVYNPKPRWRALLQCANAARAPHRGNFVLEKCMPRVMVSIGGRGQQAGPDHTGPWAAARACAEIARWAVYDYSILYILLTILGLATPRCSAQNRCINWLHFDRFEPGDIVSKGDIAMVHNQGRDNAPILPARRAARRLPDAVPRLRARQHHWPWQLPRPPLSSRQAPS